MTTLANSSYPIVVLLSGNGSTLQSIIDAHLPIHINCVISNKAQAYGLTRAKQAGIASHIVDHRQFPTREAFEQQLIRLIEPYQTKLIVLAGFMRILSPLFIHHFQNKIINIHPSLLPSYPGLHTHQHVLTAKEKEHGTSIHLVTDQLDGGPVIAQSRLTIEKNETVAHLTQRIKTLEHRLYPQVIAWFAENKLHVHHGKIFWQNKPLTQPLEVSTQRG